jgi:hypothetical protein
VAGLSDAAAEVSVAAWRMCGVADKMTTEAARGRVAQLGERIVRNDEVAGSIPVTSTIFFSIFPITYPVQPVGQKQDLV